MPGVIHLPCSAERCCEGSIRRFGKREDFGGIPKRPTGADCKSAGSRLRWFESTSLHQQHVARHCARWMRTTAMECRFDRSAGSGSERDAKRRGPGGAEGRKPGVVHLPPTAARGKALREVDENHRNGMPVRPIRRERIGTRREAARPRRGGGQDARSHPPPSTRQQVSTRR